VNYGNTPMAIDEDARRLGIHDSSGLTRQRRQTAVGPVAVYRDRQQPGIQSLLRATHSTPYVGDGLDRDRFCKKARDSHRKEEETGYNTRPAICFEHVCAYQAETTNDERDHTEQSREEINEKYVCSVKRHHDAPKTSLDPYLAFAKVRNQAAQ
jgi:hypothetical protein